MAADGLAAAVATLETWGVAVTVALDASGTVQGVAYPPTSRAGSEGGPSCVLAQVNIRRL